MNTVLNELEAIQAKGLCCYVDPSGHLGYCNRCFGDLRAIARWNKNRRLQDFLTAEIYGYNNVRELQRE